MLSLCFLYVISVSLWLILKSLPQRHRDLGSSFSLHRARAESDVCRLESDVRGQV